ncbi:hypothetical protein LO762_10080 [Actinocorallia sp. API 0066]|uniref:hypothetical protein n=1 Tax=Actinocorallia sp. API 0066 TaxID=2896846 RepID=UPI001E39B733|nr:hypothetical protein [Actinocorallia sp. API 0066]MCD0449536.1 hypothetical protein [Actinocorallia sp. API 0066]
MRGAVLGWGLGAALLLSSGPALADGGLEVNPSSAKRGQTIGVSTGDNCRETDGEATISSSAFPKVETTVTQGEANVSVTISGNAAYETHLITLTCSPSKRKIEGAVTVKQASSDRCWQDENGQWHGRCYGQGPETGFGGSLGSGPTATGLAGLGLLGTAAALLLVRRIRATRA